MSIEVLASGLQNGLDWTVDHDNAVGTVGITVTGSPQRAGTLMLHAQVFTFPGNVLLTTLAPIRIDGFANLGRQVEITNAALVGITMLGGSEPFELNLWTNFQPS